MSYLVINNRNTYKTYKNTVNCASPRVGMNTGGGTSYIPVGNGNYGIKVGTSRILEYTQGTYLANHRVVTTKTVYESITTTAIDTVFINESIYTEATHVYISNMDGGANSYSISTSYNKLINEFNNKDVHSTSKSTTSSKSIISQSRYYNTYGGYTGWLTKYTIAFTDNYSYISYDNACLESYTYQPNPYARITIFSVCFNNATITSYNKVGTYYLNHHTIVTMRSTTNTIYQTTTTADVLSSSSFT